MLDKPRSPHPPRWLHWQARLLRALLWLLVAAWLLLGLSWVALHQLIVPRVDQWRPALERMASEALGVKVEIGALTANSSGPVPSLQLRDVVLRDAAGAEALRLPSVRAALSLPSLWRLGFDQIVVEGAVLELRRSTDGRWLLGGIDLGHLERTGDESPLADWLLGQTELALLQGTLRWHDQTRPTLPVAEFTGIDLVLRNPGRQHQFRLDATPPAHWGQRLSVRGDFTRAFWQLRPSQWRYWRGTLYADLPWVDWAHMGRYIDAPNWLGLQVQQGQGAARLWLDWQRGALRQASADLGLQRVQLQWPEVAQPFELQNLQTRLELQHEGLQTTLSTHGLGFRTADGLVWPGGNVRHLHTRSSDTAPAGFALQAERLDAQVLSQLALQLPLPALAHQWLRDTAPSGLVEQIQMQWSAAQAAGAGQTAGADQTGAAASWSASGRLRNVGLRAGAAPPVYRHAKGWDVHTPGRPGIGGADLDFNLTSSGGQAELRLDNGHLDLPGVFAQPRVTLQRLQAGLSWRVVGDQITVEVPRLLLRNPDLEAELQLNWRSADPALSPARARFPGVIELDGRILRADAAQVVRYLPLNVGPETKAWLRSAIVAGRIEQALVRVRGDLRNFPYQQPGSGVFTLEAPLHDVQLDYAPAHLLPAGSPPWPTLQVPQARLLIEGTRLRLEQASAQVRPWPQLRIVQAQAEIPDFMATEPQLRVNGQLRGPATDALALVRSSPLRQMTEAALDQAQASGALELGLQLEMPLNDTNATRVRGQLRFAGNELRIGPESPTLQALHGVLNFSESGFDIPAASAQMLGGPLRFSGRMATEQGQSVLRLRGTGQATALGLSQAEPWPWLAPLGRAGSGSATYQAELRIGPEGTSVQVDSNLQGLALQLPAPLSKSAEAALPLRLRIEPLAGAPRGATRDELQLELGSSPTPWLSLHYQREHRGAATRVLRGSVAVRSARPALPASGVLAALDLGDFDADAWARLYAAPQVTPAPTTAAAPAPAASALSLQDSRPYWPTQWRLQAARITHSGRSWHDLSLSGSLERDTWRATVVARELAGQLSYRAGGPQAAGLVHARLSRLDWPRAGVEQPAEAVLQQPNAMPAIDLVIERLRLDGRELGRLEVQAANRVATQGPQAGVSEWRLNALTLNTPEATLKASGNWVAHGLDATARRTALRLELDIRDAGALLTRMGQPQTIRGGQGRIEGHLGWLGSPLNFDTPSLSGELQLDVGRGQFLRAEPGVAKLIGVLSLQALPRRLMLDFRDVFSEGFAFDFIRGNVSIAQGVARSNNLQMKGINAAVLLEGSADTVRETQDLRVVVVPELNADTVSLVATLINPITGLGAFLAQFLLRQPLQQAATREFHITGPWADPVVTPVQRQPAARPDPNAPTGAN
ncbi:MAG: TIGR02099 family protein [Betaproteobacteria bacterium]|nr:TIGR02099 family protein [Betaproteobacteria bacterium]